MASRVCAPCSACSEPASRPSQLVLATPGRKMTALTHGLHRRHKIDEFASHATRLRVSHRPRPRRRCGCVGHHRLARTPDRRSPPRADVLRLGARGSTGLLVTPEQKARCTPEVIAVAAAALVDTVRLVRPLVHQIDIYPPSPLKNHTHGLYVQALVFLLTPRCSLLDHKQCGQDAIRQRHSRARRVAHHGRSRSGTSRSRVYARRLAHQLRRCWRDQLPPRDRRQ